MVKSNCRAALREAEKRNGIGPAAKISRKRKEKSNDEGYGSKLCLRGCICG